MSTLRVAILCGGPFAYPSLLKLAYEKFLCGIVIATENAQVAANLREESEKQKFPFLHVESKADLKAMEQWIEEVKPDAVFSICFPYKIPASTLQLVPDRFFNFHPGPLPAYRGPSPIFEVLKHGEKETAIAVHYMAETYDSGNIVFTEKLRLADGENYQSLTMKLSSRCGIAAMNLAEMLNFGSGKISGTKQDENSAAFYPFPAETDLTIDWEKMKAEEIIALINACHSWTRGAITKLGDEQLRIPAAMIVSDASEESFPAGTIIKTNDDGSCVVVCADRKQIMIPALSSDFGPLGTDYLQSIGFAEKTRLG